VVPNTRVLVIFNNFTSDFRATKQQSAVVGAIPDQLSTERRWATGSLHCTAERSYEQIRMMAENETLRAVQGAVERLQGKPSTRCWLCRAPIRKAEAIAIYMSGSRSDVHAADDTLGLLTDRAGRERAEAPLLPSLSQAFWLVGWSMAIVRRDWWSRHYLHRRRFRTIPCAAGRRMHHASRSTHDIDIAGTERRDESGK